MRPLDLTKVFLHHSCVGSLTKTGGQFIFHRIHVCYIIYGNIYHQYTPNVTIHSIHGSYGFGWIWVSGVYPRFSWSFPAIFALRRKNCWAKVGETSNPSAGLRIISRRENQLTSLKMFETTIYPPVIIQFNGIFPLSTFINHPFYWETPMTMETTN